MKNQTFDKYIVWQSRIRGQNNRDSKVIECSSLESAMSFYDVCPFKNSTWIEPVRVR